MMIYVGLTGWGDHDSLYPKGLKQTDKLKEYSKYFPTVEVDSSFYAIQPKKNIDKWLRETPDSFQFIMKAYQEMTGHQRGPSKYESKQEMFEQYALSVRPMKEAGKLAMVLCQFPPWFECNRENVDYLRYLRDQLHEFPCALEFRHESWFHPTFREKTLEFMKNEDWIHSVVDEPQIEGGSVPIVEEATTSSKTLIRLHGRDKNAWLKPARGQEWRKVRYRYNYSDAELREWQERAERLQKESSDVYMIFNNNSERHAAPNARRLLELSGIEYEGLTPKQTSLFDDDTRDS